MSDDIRALTTRLAEEPSSLAFLELAEALRRRGQLDAAAKVARGGVCRYPGLADAHDLLARILSDQGDLAGAFDAWADALRLDPMRTGALKGIAFLYFRAGDTAAAIEHLQRAAEVDPDDPSICPGAGPGPARVAGAVAPDRGGRRAGSRAGFRARGRLLPQPAPPASADLSSPFAELEAADSLCWWTGTGSGWREVSLARTARRPATGSPPSSPACPARPAGPPGSSISGAGSPSRWSRPTRNFVLVRPTGETVLLAARDPSLPMARVALVAERAARCRPDLAGADAMTDRPGGARSGDPGAGRARRR